MLAAEADPGRLSGATVLLDCRRLGTGGAERATELLLRGLRESPPPGRWLLWGPDAAAPYAWPGAEHIPSRHSPNALLGQRDLLGVPRHDVALYLHQVRPLRPGRGLTLVHDTIPLRHGGGPATRRLKRLFLWAVVRLSTHVLTVSEHSRRSIVEDLGAPPEKVSTVAYPVDAETSERVWALRQRSAPEDVALSVGRFAPHKNLDRLVLAFGRTDFRRRGGRLVLVGGDEAGIARLRALAAAHGIDGVEPLAVCPQERLERLLAGARLLVLPSLEEGFGLPAWEALAAGVPVAASDAGSLPEVTRGLAETFPPTSLGAMADAIDRAAASSPERDREQRERFLATAPSLAEYARTVVAAVARSVD